MNYVHIRSPKFLAIKHHRFHLRTGWNIAITRHRPPSSCPIFRLTRFYPTKVKTKCSRGSHFGSSSFEIFAGRDLSLVYATVSELAQALEVQPATVTAQLSGSLTKLPGLAAWLTHRGGDDCNMTPISQWQDLLRSEFFVENAAQRPDTTGHLDDH